jgi:hypothetical protein
MTPAAREDFPAAGVFFGEGIELGVTARPAPRERYMLGRYWQA